MTANAPNIDWYDYSFSELTTEMLYSILRLRQEVFIIEQNCNYLDADGVDLTAFHLMGLINNEPAMYTRYFIAKDNPQHGIIGRVIVHSKFRGLGLGLLLMEHTERCFKQRHNLNKITLGAQAHLKLFYEQLGYRVYGAPYDEDNIPHLPMRKNIPFNE